MAELLEPFRAALEGASVVPGRYMHPVSAALVANLLLVGIVLTAVRAFRSGSAAAALERSLRDVQRLGAVAAALLAFVVNPWVAAALLSRDGELRATTSALILVATTTFLGCAAWLLVRARTASWPRRLAARLARTRWSSSARPSASRDWAIGLGLTCVLLLNVEAVFYARQAGWTGPVRRMDIRALDGSGFPGLFEPRRGLGYGPPANAAAQVKASFDGRVIYDVRYTFGPGRERVTPHPDPMRAVAAAAFFGGSFTFGEGVEDHEALPARVAARWPWLRPVNFGYSGYGPQHMLALLERGSVEEAIDLPLQAAIYLFIDGHVARAVGSYRIVTSYGREFPYYDFGNDGRLQHRGTFTSGRPWRSRLYGLLGASYLVRAFGLEFPRQPGPAHFDRTAAIVASAAEILEQRDGATLFVVIYPGSLYGTEIATRLRPRGVAVLDYSSLFDPAAPGYAIAGDGHPSPRAYDELAARLVADLRTALRLPAGGE